MHFTWKHYKIHKTILEHGHATTSLEASNAFSSLNKAKTYVEKY